MRLSVAIPTVGRESLQYTLNSLVRQTVDPFEVIVVNQGDVGLETRMPYVPGVRYIHQRERGLSRARNVAFQEFAGDWLAFIDDDEEANAEWIEQIQSTVKAYPASGFLGGVYFAPIGHDETLGFCSELFALGEQPIDHSTWMVPTGIPKVQADAWGGNSAFSRECVDRVGLNDVWLGRGAPHFTSGEDSDYILRALSAGIVGMCSCRIIIYHTFGTRPISDENERELVRMCAVAQWKASRDPKHVSQELAARFVPFGGKKSALARLSKGAFYKEHLERRQWFDEALSLLNERYSVENGVLVG